MSKRLICVSILLAFLVVLPKGFAEPRDGWSLESRVPATALAVLSLEDVGLWGERFEKTAIAGLFREPEMKAFAEPIEKAMTEGIAAGGGNLFGEAQPLVMKLLEQLSGLRGQVAVALLGVDMDAGMPRLAASLDFGEHIADFAQFLEGVRKELDPQGTNVGQFEKDGRTWWQNQGGGPPVTATTVDTAFVIATDPTLLESVVAGAQADSLASSPAFQSVRRRASGGGDLGMLAYANVPAIVDLFEPMMDDETRIITTALGLDTIQAAGYGMAFSGDGFMDSLVLHAPGADHGIVSMIEMPPFQPRALHLVPGNAFYYNEGSINVADLLPNIRRLGASVSPGFAEQMDQGLAHLHTMLGVDLEKDVLAGLAGPSMTYLSMPQTGGLYPEVGIFLQVKDPAAYEEVFGRLARGIAGAVTEEGDVIASTRTLDYRGKRLHLFEMQAARGNDVVPFTPTWMLMDDWLVLTLVPHAMKEIVLRATADTPVTGGGLAAQEDFRSLRALMPKDAGAIDYIDLQAVLNLLYDTGVPLLQTAVKPNVIGREIPFPLDWAQLPAARTVRPYFRSMAIFTTWNRDGIAIQMPGPIPMAGVVMIAAAIAIPAFLTMRRPMGAVRARSIPKPPRGEKPGPRPLEPDKPALPAATKTLMARGHAAQISRYVRTFLLTENRLPANLEELVASGTVGRLPQDPWGHDYSLRILDKRTRRFQVVSAGPDGLFDTEDDVRSRK